MRIAIIKEKTYPWSKLMTLARMLLALGPIDSVIGAMGVTLPADLAGTRASRAAMTTYGVLYFGCFLAALGVDEKRKRLMGKRRK